MPSFEDYCPHAECGISKSPLGYLTQPAFPKVSSADFSIASAEVIWALTSIISERGMRQIESPFLFDVSSGCHRNLNSKKTAIEAKRAPFLLYTVFVAGLDSFAESGQQIHQSAASMPWEEAP
jgi:hypothetical protein